MPSFTRGWVRFLFAVVVLVLVGLSARTASAYPGFRNVNTTITSSGYITSTLVDGSGCISCHGTFNSATSTFIQTYSPAQLGAALTLSGTGTGGSGTAFTIQPNTTGTFELTFHAAVGSAPAPARAGGFLVYHLDGTNNSNGTLGAIGAEHTCKSDVNDTLCGGGLGSSAEIPGNNTEVMHSQPQQTSGNYTFDFSFTSPKVCSGTFHFRLWYNATNADSNCASTDSSGSMDFTVTIASCDDGNACTSNSCVGGTGCVFGSPPACNSPSTCQTSVGAACNPSNGLCVYPITNGASCDDGNACTTGTTCNSAGSCVGGSAVPTDDGNVCTTDGCNTSTGVFHNPISGTTCNDGNACTTGETCHSGVCNGGSALPTDDGNACTADGCDTSTGVFHNPLSGIACNDGNACTTGEMCNSGVCNGGTALPTDDGNVCTQDGCNTSTGVFHNPLSTGACDDGNPCTTGTTCNAGVCSGGSATSIDDGNPCTTDACTSGGGITHTPAPSSVTCHDGTRGVCDVVVHCDGVSTSCPAFDVDHTHKQCSGPSCSNGPPSQATPAGQCDGTNFTCPAVTPVSCNGQACSGTSCGGGCNGDDSKCISGDFCSTANACTPKFTNGTSCQTNNQCSTGNCVDGVCCNTACGGGVGTDCQACNVAGSLGSCIVPVNAVCRTSRGICDAVETCQSGNTACPADAPAPANTVCRASTDGNVCDPAETCGGAFACPPDTATRDGQGCTDDSNVCSVDVCAGNVCTHTTPAAASVVCRSSTGVCDPAENCDGSTTACPSNTVYDATHVCRPAATGTLCDVAETCTTGSGACPADGFAAATVSCRSASCSAGTLTQPASCPGTSSACPTATTKSCSPYLCANGSACATGCAVKTDCADGNYCNSAGKCVAELPPGGVCSASEQCGTGICVDSRCCNTQCNGQCQACDVTGLEGTCSPIKDKVPHGSRTKCVGDGSACQGFCDGTDTANCSEPGATTQCLAPSCTNGVATPVENCNGSGICPTQAPVTCAPGICQAATGPKAICVGGGGTPCTADVECSAGHYCVAGQCKAQNPDGGACGADDQCVNGHCVDGLCCNTSCDGQCEACDATNSKGTCTPITDKPHGARPACVSDPQYPSCAGVCDGKNANACTFPGPGTSCRDASCTKGLAILPASCTGTGTCSPEQDQTCPGDCNADGKICDNGCSIDGDCPMNQYCSGGVCVPTLGPGAQCSTSSQCVGACVDGYCCNTACDHQCEACNVVGKEGTCTAVTGAPVGLREACATDGTAACAGKCDGTNRNACAFPKSTVQCSAGACADGVATLTAFCDGAGSCPTTQHQICAPADCSGTQCGGDCASGQACGAGNYCSAGVCRPTLPQGTACASDAQCAGGNCVDGFCCNSSCDGQCQACDVAGSEGTCTTLTNDLPHGGRAACQGLGACAALCDGTNPSGCTYASATVKCGKASCAQNGEAIPAPSCNGAGVCLAGAVTNCGSYTCDDGSGACLTSCILQSDCAPGYECAVSKCVPATTDGGVTTDAGTGGNAMMPDGSMMTDASSGKGGSSGFAGATETDAATTDSGMGVAGENDGGLVPPGHSTDKGSCGCSVPGSESRGSNALWLAGLTLIGVAVRRRRNEARRAA